MKVKIKRLHNDAIVPKYAKAGDAGLDLTAVSMNVDEFGNMVYGTGLAFEIPEGYVGLLFPRSSNCKVDQFLTNCVGVIDSGYRGEVTFKFKPSQFVYRKSTFATDVVVGSAGTTYHKMQRHGIGDRVGQIIIMPYPQIEFEEVDELSETERGAEGYGSTGK